MPTDDDLDVRTLPLTEATGLLNRDRTRLDIAETNLTQARLAYDSQVVNGSYADIPDVRERLEAQYGSALREAEAAAETAATAIANRARGIAEATQTARPNLSSGDMVQAGAFAPFAENDCRELPLRDLAAQVRAAVVADDRAKMFAYARFLPKRLAAAPTGRADSDGDARNDLRTLTHVIADRLADPAFAPVNERASALRMRAEKIRRDAGTRSRAAYRERNPYAFQSAGDVRRG